MEGRILLIEDEQSILDVLVECFVDENFEVKAMEGVHNIVEVVRGFKPDIVMIDYLLRGVNGGELCFELKLIYPTLPVIIMSAYPKHALALDQYKCDLFIAKPFDIYNLVEEVKLLGNNCKLGKHKNALQ